tara:strand:+ start:42 stop:1520 length:1479 start_codon:yes stop_codon:yes gene_type:complete
MKLHFLLAGTRNGTEDIDKKLPFLQKKYPKSNIRKVAYADDRNFTIVENIYDDIKLLEINKVKINSDVSVDIYTTSFMSYSFIKITTDIQGDSIKDIDKLKVYNFLDSKLLLDGEEQSVMSLFSKVLLPFYQFDVLMDIFEKNMSNMPDIIDQERIREDIYEKINFNIFFVGNGPAGGINGRPGPIILEDNDNEINLDNSWDDIGAIENQVFEHKNENMFLTKKTDFIEVFLSVLATINMRNSFLSQSTDLCETWLNQLKGEVVDVRKNISSSHANKFYWQELKKRIEIMDLNFLEFHSSIVSEIPDMLSFPQSKHLNFSINYTDRYKNKRKIDIDLLYCLLNEVKYAISNLSTPGHTHDEKLLQEETEKVHERLLMISFIAMAIPFGIAVLSQEISTQYKIFSAISLLLIPVVYFSLRKIQKVVAVRRNKKAEIKKQLKDTLKSIDKNKQVVDSLKSAELPEDIKTDILSLQQKTIEMMEKRVMSLEKRAK